MKTRVKCLNVCTVFLSVAILALGGLLLLPLGALASHKPCACSQQICSAQGFDIKLTDFNVDQMTGMSSWTYEVCREKVGGLQICSPGFCDGGGDNGHGCTTSVDCDGGNGCVTSPGGGGSGTTGETCTQNSDCAGYCVPCAPAAGLGRVDIVLPGLGECITDQQTVTIEKIGSTGTGTCTAQPVTNQDSTCPDQLCAPGTPGKLCTGTTQVCDRTDCPGGTCSMGTCSGGSQDGKLCCNSGTCDPVQCQPVTGICTGGTNAEQPCYTLMDCPDKISMDAACTTLTGNCVGGVNDGMQCTTAANCAAPGVCNWLDVLKCDSANLNKGDCVDLKVTVAGEIPTIGPGTIDTVIASQGECAADQICGPACACEVTPPGEGCLTRSKGFWGNHPVVTNDFLAVTACGKSLSTIPAGTQTSVTEALCSNPNDAGKGKVGNQAYVSLLAQLAAAKLNFEASTDNDGDCSDMLSEALTNAGCPYTTLAEIESNLCCADQKTISGSKCIEGLTNFNIEQDTFDMTPPPFDVPGRADPSQCNIANGDKKVINPVCGP